MQGFPAGQASPRIARFLWPEDSWPVTAPAAAIVMRIVRMYEEPGLRLYPMIDRVAQDFLQYFGPEDMTLSQGPTRVRSAILPKGRHQHLMSGSMQSNIMSP